MSCALIRRPRNANMGGDPTESARLRPLFLAWVGKRSTRECLVLADIPHRHGTDWLGEKGLLADVYQRRVRLLLGDMAGAP